MTKKELAYIGECFDTLAPYALGLLCVILLIGSVAIELAWRAL